jgi:uncharacterized membrane protein
MKSYRTALLIFTALLLGGTLRLYFAYNVAARPDEDAYLAPARVMREYIEEGELEKIPNVDVTWEHPQLVKLMFSLTLDEDDMNEIPTKIVPGKTTPLPEHSLRNSRLQTITVSVLTLFTVALTSPLAALLLAIDPIHFQFGSTAYIDAMPTLFTALMAYFYVRAKHNVRRFLLSGVCLGVAVACKYPYAWVGVILVMHLLVYRAFSLKHIFLWGMLAVAVFYLLNPYIWENPIERVYDQLTFHEDYADTQLEKDNHALLKPIDQLTEPRYYLPSKVKHEIWNPLGKLVFALAIPGTAVLLYQKSFYGWWMVLGLLFLMVWPTQWIQHNMMIVVPYTLAAATGLRWLWQHITLRIKQPVTDHAAGHSL